MIASTSCTSVRACNASATRLQRTFCSSRIRCAGTFRNENGLQIFHERKILPYTPKQLYSIVADTDSYQRFIPFVTSSKVLRHQGPGDMQQRPWLDIENGAGDTHKMDHEMRIGVLGFDERWVSHVTCEKFRQVAAVSETSNLFKALRTTWTLAPAPSNAPHPSSESLPQGSAALKAPGQPSQNTDSQGDADGPTLVSIDLSWQFANPLYAAAAGSAFQRVSGKIMEAFEKRVREVHGNGKR